MKSEGRPNQDLQPVIAELKKMKAELTKRENELTPPEDKLDRAKLEDTLKRRFFYNLAFSLYGGEWVWQCLLPLSPLTLSFILPSLYSPPPSCLFFLSLLFPSLSSPSSLSSLSLPPSGVGGLYDFGPMGCAMKSNILSLWRQHFVLEEGMLEIDGCILTPEPVLK